MDGRGSDVPCSSASSENSDSLSISIKEEMFSEFEESTSDNHVDNTDESDVRFSTEDNKECQNDSVAPFSFVGIKIEQPDDYESEAYCVSSETKYSSKEWRRDPVEKCDIDNRNNEGTVHTELSNVSSIDIKMECEEDIDSFKSELEANENMPVKDWDNKLDCKSEGHSSNEFILGSESQEYPILPARDKHETGEQLAGKSNNGDGDKEKRFTCSECERSFPCINELNKHMRTHTGANPFICTVCRATFEEDSALKAHGLTHTGEELYPCSVCEKTFRHFRTAKQHMLTHTEEEPYVCNTCEVSFKHKSSLDMHMRSHFVCTVCQSAFSTKRSMTRHMLTHVPERPFLCSDCDKSFRDITSLKKHMITHSGEKPYVCVECEASFSQKYSLKTHMRNHTGEKPYSCDLCEMMFSEKKKLARHIRTHTGEKPYVCEVCAKSFTDIYALKRHRFREKQYVCTVCDEAFCIKSNLKKHKSILKHY